MSLQIKMRDKSGISGMVGYVLLIGIVMSIGTFLYIFLQSYVPTEELTCQDGAAISVLRYECEAVDNTYTLHITLKNSGRFNLLGYSIYSTNSPEKVIGTYDLSGQLEVNPKTKSSGAQSVFFTTTNEDGFKTSESIEQVFSSMPVPVFFVDITPIMKIIDDKNRIHTVHCGGARIKERIVC